MEEQYLKNRTITVVLFVLTLSIFLIYFIIQGMIFSFGRPIVTELNNIINFANQNKWKEAEISVSNLVYNWDKQKHILAFNYAEEDYSIFLDNLARLKGAVRTKDETETVNLASSSLILWNNFIKLVPEP